MSSYNIENGMDSTISELKTRLFDLEQQEKDYNALRQKLAQLKKDYSVLNNTKNRLEQELKQKDDSYNQRISNLRGENENLQLGYNEKLSLNKKLFQENDALEKEIELRDLSNQLNKSLAEKGDLENQVQKLKNLNNSQANEINKLTNENKNLNNIANDQEKRLQHDQEEIAMLNNKSKENDENIQNLNGKLKDLVNNINNTQNELNKNNAANRDLADKIKNLECQCTNLKCENNSLNNNILKEKACRAERERQNKALTDAINDNDNQINDLTNKYNALKNSFEQVSEESKNYRDNNNKLKEHIMVLSQQNQRLLNELENVKDQDLRLKTLFGRKDQSNNLLRGVQSCIEQSSACLRKVENDPLGCCNNLRSSGERVRVNSSERYRSRSPRYI